MLRFEGPIKAINWEAAVSLNAATFLYRDLPPPAAGGRCLSKSRQARANRVLQKFFKDQRREFSRREGAGKGRASPPIRIPGSRHSCAKLCWPMVGGGMRGGAAPAA